jgi:hypothetical protein
LNPVLTKFCVQFVGVVSIVPDQVLRSLWNYHLNQSGNDQSHFVRSSTFDAYGHRKAMTVRHGHDLGPFATGSTTPPQTAPENRVFRAVQNHMVLTLRMIRVFVTLRNKF